MLPVALDRNDEDRFRLERVDLDNEAEIAGQVAADLPPRLRAVVGTHHIPVLLHIQRFRPRGMHRNPVHAVPDFGRRIRNVLRVQPLVGRLPARAAIVAAHHARR